MKININIMKYLMNCIICACVTTIVIATSILLCKDFILKHNETNLNLVGEPIPEEELKAVQTMTSTVNTSDNPYVTLSEDDMYMIAQILYLEARGESVECQEAVVSVIVNRMANNNMSAEEVIFADKQFTTANFIEKGQPSDEMIELVQTIAMEGPTIPSYVTYFRAGHFHEWDNEYGHVMRYDKLDNTYFSYDVKLKEEYDKQIEVY